MVGSGADRRMKPNRAISGFFMAVPLVLVISSFIFPERHRARSILVILLNRDSSAQFLSGMRRGKRDKFPIKSPFPRNRAPTGRATLAASPSNANRKNSVTYHLQSDDDCGNHYANHVPPGVSILDAPQQRFKFHNEAPRANRDAKQCRRIAKQ